MSFPTGMSPGTGLHYQNVAAQMQAYVNNGGGHSPHGSGMHPVYGGMYQQHHSHPMPMAPPPQYGGGMRFVDPVIANDPGEFARRFMRNLLI